MTHLRYIPGHAEGFSPRAMEILRQSRGMSMAERARRTGLTVYRIRKIERVGIDKSDVGNVRLILRELGYPDSAARRDLPPHQRIFIDGTTKDGEPWGMTIDPDDDADAATGGTA